MFFRLLGNRREAINQQDFISMHTSAHLAELLEETQIFIQQHFLPTFQRINCHVFPPPIILDTHGFLKVQMSTISL